MKKIIIIMCLLLFTISSVSAATYESYYNSPFGLNYLAADIMPWEDYVIIRTDDYTSVSIYGQADDEGVFQTATVRTVTRDTGYGGSYTTNETTKSNVSVYIAEPYYCYSNIYGVPYDLPSNQNITSICVCSSFALIVLINIFRLVWSFRKGVAK